VREEFTPMLRGVPISLLAALILLAAGAEAASLRSSAHDGVAIAAMRAGSPETQRALSARPAWTDFTSRYGRWNALWNEATNTPHRAFGPELPARGYADDAGSVDRAVRAFIASQPALFGGAGIQLETVSATRHADVWYVRYRQSVRGIPITFSDWEFRVGRNGKLMMFGADARDPAAITSLTPTIPAACRARGRARRPGVRSGEGPRRHARALLRAAAAR
jgi:hypothetical protein